MFDRGLMLTTQGGLMAFPTRPASSPARWKACLPLNFAWDWNDKRRTAGRIASDIVG